MDTDALTQLLRRTEHGLLEFKREWYKLDSENKVARDKQTHELIRDILSLANGNIIVAGQPAYLVIGASDVLRTDGTRELFGVVQNNITPLRIRDIVNAACDPPIEELYCDAVLMDNKRIIVVTIPPTPHVFETTKDLHPSKGSYSKYTVFVRHSEGIVPASTMERNRLAQIKRLAFRENHGAPAVPFGTVLGAMAGGAVASALTGTKIMAKKSSWPFNGVLGAATGAWIGMCIGYVYRTYLEMRPSWFRVPAGVRFFSIALSIVGATTVWWLLELLRGLALRQLARWESQATRDAE